MSRPKSSKRAITPVNPEASDDLPDDLLFGLAWSLTEVTILKQMRTSFRGICNINADLRSNTRRTDNPIALTVEELGLWLKRLESVGLVVCEPIQRAQWRTSTRTEVVAFAPKLVSQIEATAKTFLAEGADSTKRISRKDLRFVKEMGDILPRFKDLHGQGLQEVLHRIHRAYHLSQDRWIQFSQERAHALSVTSSPLASNQTLNQTMLQKYIDTGEGNIDELLPYVRSSHLLFALATLPVEAYIGRLHGYDPELDKRCKRIDMLLPRIAVVLSERMGRAQGAEARYA